MSRSTCVTAIAVGRCSVGGRGAGRVARVRPARSGASIAATSRSPSCAARLSQRWPRARMSAKAFAPSSPSPPSRLVSRLSQRDGTVSASSPRFARVRITDVPATACWKSWAERPTRRSGDSRPNAARILRLSQGSGPGCSGQPCSLSPPRTTISALCTRASSVPRMITPGWLSMLRRTSRPDIRLVTSRP